MEKVGLIAGEGEFPLKIANALKEKNYFLSLIEISGFTNPEIRNFADEKIAVKLGQLQKTIKFLKKSDTRKVILAGRIKHTSVFSIKPDLLTIKILSKIPDKRAKSLLKAICDEFEKNGIKVLSSVELLSEFLAQEKVYTKRKPTKSQLKDIEFGKKIARQITALDIGQTVIVKDATVVAVEAMEGTNKCIERAGEIAGEGCVCVKFARPDQDFRFDVPVVGADTVQHLAKIKAKVLAIQKDLTLFLNPEKAIEIADKNGISIVGVARD